MIMFTALASFALAATPAAAPSWESDYRQACAVAARESKPLAVVLGKGEAGWDALVSDTTLGAVMPAAARTAYVWHYVDTTTDAGRKLARDFRTDGPALILSDRSGDVQAYRHQGRIGSDSLKTVLTRYADPAREVRRTETNVAPATVPAPVQIYAPVRSNCATCGSCPSCR